MNNDTIAAIATPAGSGGIGIIKISGPRAITIATTLFCKSASGFPEDIHRSSNRGQTLAPSEFQSHRLYHGVIIDPGRQQIIDEVLLVIMKTPHSYTTEDVVEIQAHASQVALQRILESVVQQGARLASPGEFTKRAFLNGRIDLTQAEAVIDVINARTTEALSMAVNQLSGGMKIQVEHLLDSLTDVQAQVDAAIDFSDDLEDDFDTAMLAANLNSHIVEPIQELLQYYTECHLYRDGLKLAIVGRPNVGKSSLLNRLVEKDRVIVADTPGTTRDPVEETIQIEGLPVIFIDTAGIHDTDDPIEKIGVSKADEYIQQADFVLFIIEAHRLNHPRDLDIYHAYRNKPMLLVINKIDLIPNVGTAPAQIPEAFQNIPRVLVSAKFDQGIQVLKKTILNMNTGECRFDIQQRIVPNMRHQLDLREGLQAAEDALMGLKEGAPYELVALDLKKTKQSLDRILGTHMEVDLLDRIFNRFCVGK